MTAPDRLTYLNLGPEGRFTATGEISSRPEDVDAIIAHLEAQTAPRLVLYFHGGLNRESEGLEHAARMGALFSQAGSHPVSIVWETGVRESLCADLDRIHRTALFKRLLDYVLRWAGSRLGLPLGERGPGEALSLAERSARFDGGPRLKELDAIQSNPGAHSVTEAELESMEAEIAAELERAFDGDEELLKALSERTAAELERGARTAGALGFNPLSVAAFAAKVVVAVVRRHLRGRDHGPYTTAVEEILRQFYAAEFGAFLWSAMKHKAEQMWAPNGGLTGPDLHGGRYLLEQLAALQQRRPELVIDAVGHSAGAIAVCGMLDAAAALTPPPHFRTIAFLAPAARSDRFERGVIRNASLFQRFRMFAMRDELEKTDPLLTPIYVRSLLYLVSGCFEEEVDAEICGMQRFFDPTLGFESDQAHRLAEWLQREDRLVLSTTGETAPAGRQSDATAHGAFDDDPATQRSLLALLA